MDTKYCEAFELNSTEHKHVRIADIWNRDDVKTCSKAIGIFLTYVSLIIMVRNCYVHFILYYAWRWIQNTAKLLN